MALCSHQHLNRTSTGSAFRRQESLEKYRTSANGVIAKVELQVLPHQNQQWCVFKCLPGFQTHIGDHWSRPKWRSKLDCHSDSLPEVLPRQNSSQASAHRQRSREKRPLQSGSRHLTHNSNLRRKSKLSESRHNFCPCSRSPLSSIFTRADLPYASSSALEVVDGSRITCTFGVVHSSFNFNSVRFFFYVLNLHSYNFISSMVFLLSSLLSYFSWSSDALAGQRHDRD